jgi:hypothetical protein
MCQPLMRNDLTSSSVSKTFGGEPPSAPTPRTGRVAEREQAASAGGVCVRPAARWAPMARTRRVGDGAAIDGRARAAVDDAAVLVVQLAGGDGYVSDIVALARATGASK